MATNRINGSSARVVLFDMLNMADQEAGKASAPQAYARLELLKYLRALPAEPGEQYAIFVLGKSLRVLQDFTGDRDRLIEATTRLSPEHSPDQAADDLGADLLASAPNTGDAITNAMARNSIKEMQDFAVKNRALITAQALESIAGHLRGISGRKKLVWLSSSFPASRSDVRERNGMPLLEHQDFGHEINHAVRALNDANIGIYPIDPRDPYYGGVAAEGIDAMNLLAHGTGGRAFYSISDLAGAIETAVADTDVTYTLGFYPQDVRLDGSYHSLAVKVARTGVDVRARTGYYATESAPPSEKQRRQALGEILGSPLNATGILLSARTEPVPAKSGEYELEVAFDLNEIHLEREGDRWVALLDLVTYFPGGKAPNMHEESLKLSLADQRLREAMASAYRVRRPLHVDRAGELRVILRDRITGAAGSVHLRAGATQ